MKVFNLYKLVAVILAASIMVACQSTPEDSDDVSDSSGDAVDTTSMGTGDDGGVSSSDLGGMSGDDTLASVQDAATTFYFDFDQSSLNSNAVDALQLHASYLSSNSSASVRLEGYADERGTREYNVALGERRGNAVMKFFVVNGVSASQIQVVSYGEENPVDTGHNESAWSANRRVELSYSSGQP